MIILEGMDNSGKTTLANQLKDKLPNHYVSKLSKNGKPTDEQLNTLLRDLCVNDYAHQPVILDRFSLISELVYGPLIRGFNFYGNKGNWEILLHYIHSNPFYLIYCRPPTKIIMSNMGEQMGGVIRKSTSLIDRYDEVMVILKKAVAYSPCSGMLLEYDWNNQEPLNQFLRMYKEWEN